MSDGLVRERLTEERKAWRKNHPHDFAARPETAEDGSVNLIVWHCTIPGKAGTDWEGGRFSVTIFSVETTLANHLCASSLPDSFTQMSIFLGLCLSILNEDSGWRSTICVRQILIGIQDLLDEPNPISPSQIDAYQLFMQDKAEYKTRVKRQQFNIVIYSSCG